LFSVALKTSRLQQCGCQLATAFASYVFGPVFGNTFFIFLSKKWGEYCMIENVQLQMAIKNI
jgi:hypothetical protein